MAFLYQRSLIMPLGGMQRKRQQQEQSRVLTRDTRPFHCVKGWATRCPGKRLSFAEVLNELGGVDGFGEELEGVAAVAGAGQDFDGGGLSAEEDDAGVGTVLADGD